MRIRENSLFLISFRAERCRRSIKSSPFRSTISSFSSSVDFVLISFSSSSLFAIITTEFEEEARYDHALRVGQKCVIRTPWNVDDDEDFVMFELEGKITVEIERLAIALASATLFSLSFHSG